MSEYKSEFVFCLSRPLVYQNKGQHEEAREIILKAPSNKQRRQTARLKQGFFRALNALSSNNSGNVGDDAAKQDGISGSEVIAVIMMSDVSFEDYQETFRELVLNDIAWVDDNQRVTSPIYDSLADDDTERMMGEYISTFLLSSWMSKLMQK